MKISGFTYVRNGLAMGYPFIQSIQSVLPLVDELFVVVGDSTDGTREAVENIGDKKIIIIDSVWDMSKRAGGQIFREQSNIGLRQCKGDWLFHIQADEVLHETAPEKIRKYIELADKYEDIDGLLFPYYHFWGDYHYIRKTREVHRLEIRAFKNNRDVLSHNDSQGFRKYPDGENGKGIKLNVIKTDIPVYHYSYTRNPKLMKSKSNYFHRFWHSDEWLKHHVDEKEFDFNEVDKLDIFTGEHPKYMEDVIKNKDWDFKYDPSKSNMSFKDKLLYAFEKKFNYRLFENKNYIVKKDVKL